MSHLRDYQERAATAIEALLRQIRLPKIKFVPPGKDMRRFVADGGTLPDLNAMLAGLLPRRTAR